MYSGTAEAFGKQWQIGDVVGVFLDLIDKTISKRQSLSDSFSRHFTLNFYQNYEYWISRNQFLASVHLRGILTSMLYFIYVFPISMTIGIKLHFTVLKIYCENFTMLCREEIKMYFM